MHKFYGSKNVKGHNFPPIIRDMITNQVAKDQSMFLGQAQCQYRGIRFYTHLTSGRKEHVIRGCLLQGRAAVEMPDEYRLLPGARQSPSAAVAPGISGNERNSS